MSVPNNINQATRKLRGLTIMNCKRFAIKRKYKNELELILYLKKKKVLYKKN